MTTTNPVLESAYRDKKLDYPGEGDLDKKAYEDDFKKEQEKLQKEAEKKKSTEKSGAYRINPPVAEPSKENWKTDYQAIVAAKDGTVLNGKDLFLALGVSNIIERFTSIRDSYGKIRKQESEENWGDSFFMGAPYTFDLAERTP